MMTKQEEIDNLRHQAHRLYEQSGAEIDKLKAVVETLRLNNIRHHGKEEALLAVIKLLRDKSEESPLTFFTTSSDSCAIAGNATEAGLDEAMKRKYPVSAVQLKEEYVLFMGSVYRVNVTSPSVTTWGLEFIGDDLTPETAHCYERKGS